MEAAEAAHMQRFGMPVVSSLSWKSAGEMLLGEIQPKFVEICQSVQWAMVCRMISNCSYLYP